MTEDSKAWWNDRYQSKLAKYRFSRQLEDWKAFRNMVKKSK